MLVAQQLDHLVQVAVAVLHRLVQLVAQLQKVVMAVTELQIQ
jgi:hypothetical protein